MKIIIKNNSSNNDNINNDFRSNYSDDVDNDNNCFCLFILVLRVAKKSVSQVTCRTGHYEKWYQEDSEDDFHEGKNR